jgi:hypothetical protein
MAYGVVVDVPAPIEMYDSLHQELLRATDLPVEGLLVHVGRPTAEGFQVIEVWETKDQYDRYNREIVWPLVARLSEGHPAPAQEPSTHEFDVRGLVVPQGGIAR